jgi:hypothetical protein
MSKTCHFHDGCAWPSQYGGAACDCRRLAVGDFTPPALPLWRRIVRKLLAWRAA